MTTTRRLAAILAADVWDRTVAFLDINPVASGHVLVLPKDHFEMWTDLPADLVAGLAQAAQTVARGVVKAAGAQGFNLLMNNHRCSGQAIPHAHFHPDADLYPHFHLHPDDHPHHARCLVQQPTPPNKPTESHQATSENTPV